MSNEQPEFPGFALPDAPVFNGASGSNMFAGTMHDPLAVLDLANVFGSRLWGHSAVARLKQGGAPGVGDLYTHDLRVYACGLAADAVANALGESPKEWRSLILHTGSEAVETALKTALRARKRAKMRAFTGAYHGTFGLALAVTHREEFREPWSEQYGNTVEWTPWGEVPKLTEDVACVIVEPWQGRAGVLPPREGFHAALREECDRVGAVLIFDAVLCGAGRTGAEIAACLTEGHPDIICLGKAIGAGAVASVVIARRGLAYAAWDHGPVEPAHTSTHIGDPAACAGVISALQKLQKHGHEISSASKKWESDLCDLAVSTKLEVRGSGLLWAVDTKEDGGGYAMAERLRDEHRILVVPSGETSSSITLYPSLVITDGERERLMSAIKLIHKR